MPPNGGRRASPLLTSVMPRHADCSTPAAGRSLANGCGAAPTLCIEHSSGLSEIPTQPAVRNHKNGRCQKTNQRHGICSRRPPFIRSVTSNKETLMKQRRVAMFALTCACTGMLAISTTRSIQAFDDDNDNGFRAVPEVFVGQAGDCGAGTAAGSRIVTSAWLGGMGLPDNGGLNTSVADVLLGNPNRNDPHRGLLLSKNGPTADCSAAGATIQGVRG